jgi:hypothetical protein
MKPQKVPTSQSHIWQKEQDRRTLTTLLQNLL